MFSYEEWQKLIDQKVYGKMIFSSSPDRGLSNILYLLPFIKEKVPEVTLDIYYGFDLWQSIAKSRNDTDSLRKIDEIMKTIDSLPYVKYHGKISEPELAKEQIRSYCWVYFDTFCESYCLTAKQFQLSATPSVTSSIGALETTVGEYGIRTHYHPYSTEGRQWAVDEVVKLHKDREHWEWWSKKAFTGGQNIDWTSRYNDYWKKYL